MALSKAELEKLLGAGAGAVGLGGVLTARNLRRAAGAHKAATRGPDTSEKNSGVMGGMARLGLNTVKGVAGGARKVMASAIDPAWLNSATTTTGQRAAAYLGAAAVPGTGIYMHQTADRRNPAPQYAPQQRGPGPSLYHKQSSDLTHFLTHEKVSAGMLARFLGQNRGALAGGSRADPVTRREFLKRMGRGAVANSPLGHVGDVPWDRVGGAAMQMIAPAAAKNIPMTRRQALGAIPAVGASQGVAVLDMANALKPSVGKSMVRGALQAVNPVKPGAVAARTAGLGGVRKKLRAANAAQGMVNHPSQITADQAARVALGAPKMTAQVLQAALTAA